jgi:hypothetical protein
MDQRLFINYPVLFLIFRKSRVCVCVCVLQNCLGAIDEYFRLAVDMD